MFSIVVCSYHSFKMKTFQEYQDAAKKTDSTFPNSDSLWYIALGINGEAGEIADHVKKHARDDGGKLTVERRTLLLKECGDVLWYLQKMSRMLGSNLQEVAEMNIEKLNSRLERGKLHGSGDNR